MRPRACLVLIMFVLPACSGSETSESGEPGCECISVEEDLGPEVPEIPECMGEVCPQVQARCSVENSNCEIWGTGTSGGFDLENPDALDCALTALRDRTPGLVQWHLNIAGGYGHNDGYVLIKEDGQAIRRTWDELDLGWSVHDAQLGDLAPPADYEACLGLEDEQQRFNCLSTELTEIAKVCDEGWQSGGY